MRTSLETRAHRKIGEQHRVAEKRPDGTLELGQEGRITAADWGAERVFGLEAGALAGHQLQDFATLDQLALLLRQEALWQQGLPSVFDLAIQRPDGAIRFVEFTTVPQQRPSTAGAATAVLRDITERRDAERLLLESETRLRSITNSVQDAILMMEPPGTISYWNPAAERILGYTSAEAIGRGLHDLLAPEHYLAHQRPALNHFSRTGQGALLGQTSELTARHKDGREIVVSLSLSAVKLADGWHAVGVLRDVTQLKENSQKLHLITSALEAAANGIVITDIQGHVLWTNPAFTQLTGYSAAEVLGKISPLLKNGTQTDEFFEQVWQTVLRGDVWHGEILNRRKDGSRYPEETTLTPVRSPDGQISHLIAVKNDITRRKEFERQLQDSASLYHSLVEDLPLGIFRQDQQGQFTFVNSRFCELAGRAPEAILGHTDFDIFPQEMAERYQEQNRRVWESGKPLQSLEEHATPDGAIRCWDVAKHPLRDAQGKTIGLQGLMSDVTERRRAEILLQREQILLRTVIENLPDSVYAKDSQSRRTLANRADVRLLGFTGEEEVLGHTDFDFFPRQEAVSLVLDDQTVLHTGQPVLNREESFTNRLGQKIWLQTSKVPLRNEQGTIVGLIGVGHDITERKQAEQVRKQMEIQLRHAQKMESIGQLAAGIAHEINTPTQFIGDNTRFLLDAFNELQQLLGKYGQLLAAARTGGVSPELLAEMQTAVQAADVDYLVNEIPKAIQQTLEGVERVTRIVRAMKDFSHPGALEKTPSDLNHAIESTVTVARNEWKYVADLELDLQPGLPLVTCLCGEINQVVLNLVINAAHAIGEAIKEGEKGKIGVSTRQDGEWVEIRVSDTGRGIPQKIRSRVFDPFFTTKPVGKGSGQGLAIAHSVITDKHGGTIHFDTELGKGTTFILRLPIFEKKTGPTNAEKS